MTTPNEKGRNPGKDATRKTTAVDSKHKSRLAQEKRLDAHSEIVRATGAAPIKHEDMSAAAQSRRVLKYLRASPKTTYWLRAKGISHPAQRVKELIAEGHQISMHPVTAIDSDGFMHRGVAMYTLEGELELVDAMEVA